MSQDKAAVIAEVSAFDTLVDRVAPRRPWRYRVFCCVACFALLALFGRAVFARFESPLSLPHVDWSGSLLRNPTRPGEEDALRVVLLTSRPDAFRVRLVKSSYWEDVSGPGKREAQQSRWDGNVLGLRMHKKKDAMG